MGTDDEARIAARYADFAQHWAHGTSPLYEDWATGIAGDARVLSLIAALPHRMQQPNLLFAGARWLGSPLTTYPRWSAWLEDKWSEVVEVAAARATQTNEPGRCATILPSLSRIDGPIALLEVGAAAGLCLLPDRYSTIYHAPTEDPRLDPVSGATSFTLRCRIDDAEAVPDAMPEIVWRRGIDLSPIDPEDPDAVAWLSTLVWPGPDHDARVERLRGAAAVAAFDPPSIVTGDLLELTSAVAAESPAEATLVVFHSAVLLYLDAVERRRFADIMTGLSRAVNRRVVWLANETLGTLPEFDAQMPADAVTDHRFLQTVDGTAVALAGQHGAVYETAPFRS